MKRGEKRLNRSYTSATDNMYSCFFIVLWLFMFTIPVYSQNSAEYFKIGDSISYTSEIQWDENSLLLTITRPLPENYTVLPIARYETEKIITNSLAPILKDVLFPIPVNSRHTIQEMAMQNPLILHNLITDLRLKGNKVFSHLSKDMKEITIRFKYNIFPDIAELFVEHTSAAPLDRILGYQPSDTYTGIVIYADMKLPVHGTSEKKHLTPCLFPTIYSEQMTPVLEYTMMEPSIASQNSSASYTTVKDPSQFPSLVGDYPFRTMAIKLFGKNETDLIIPEKDARTLLGNANTRQLLKNGKILIIFSSVNTE